MKRVFTVCISLVLLSVLVLSAAGVYIPAQAAAGDRFKPSGAVQDGNPADALRTPLDFEAAAAANPVALNEAFVSRCRFAPFNNNTSFYGSLAAGTSNAVVGDTKFSFADGSQCYNPQNESNIVVNPTNSNNVVSSANEYRFDGDSVFTSFDGGKTFTDVALPGRTGATGGQGVFARLGSCGDPVVAFGSDGTLYYSGLNCNSNKVSFFSGLAVSASHDGGLTWGAPVMVSFSNGRALFIDKEFMTVGPDGTVYVSWTLFKQNSQGALFGSPIVLSTSHDGGQSWSTYVQVSDKAHPYNQGSMPLVAKDGSLYITYEGSTPSTGFMADAVMLAHSTDGGKTFTNRELDRIYDDYNCYPINHLQGRFTLSGEEFRLSDFPGFAIDRSTGTFAIVWSDDQANPGCGYEKGGSFSGVTSNQVKLITSTDGATWTSPSVITPDAPDKAYPIVAANAGRIVVSYYTRAYSPLTPDCQAMVVDTATNVLSLLPGPVCLDYAFRSSADNFASETRLTNQSSNPYLEFAGGFIGDYTGAVIDKNGNAYMTWSDNRGDPGVTWPNQDMDVAFGK